ncbi:acyltransferase [Altererythrobacter fulvus]|uniref:acyltransferase family protein n=1 Tax=Caenibius fulvus TaxID=2126012 RepID=UPI003018FDA5
MEKHWRSLDGLRGVLALAVVFLHFGINSFGMRVFGLPELRLGLAVDVFFILSGFVLTHSVRHGTTFRTFALKRLLRLMPVYYVTTLAAFLVAPELPQDLWTEFFAITPFFVRDAANYPAWSICFELYLPLLAVLVPVRLSPGLVRPALLLTLLASGICQIFVMEGNVLYLPRAILGLAAGHLLYRSKIECRVPFDAVAVGVILLILAAAFAPPITIFLPFLTSAAILAGTRGGWLFATMPAQWLGSISYTLYLVHVPVYYAMVKLLGAAAGQNPPVKLAGIGVALVLATLLTRVVERPAMALSSRLFPRPSGVRGEAA